MSAQKRVDEEYLKYSHVFDGRDEHLRARRTKIVTTRVVHQCLSPLTLKMHEIPAGTRAWNDKAICDGVWGAVYTCLECFDAYLDEERL